MQKVEYEAYYNPRKDRMNARNGVLLKQINEGTSIQEGHIRIGVSTAVIKKGVCASITTIDVDKRVYIHNTHVLDRTPIQLMVGSILECTGHLDIRSNKNAAKCKITNNEHAGEKLSAGNKRDRGRSRGKHSYLFKK